MNAPRLFDLCERLNSWLFWRPLWLIGLVVRNQPRQGRQHGSAPTAPKSLLSKSADWSLALLGMCLVAVPLIALILLGLIIVTIHSLLPTLWGFYERGISWKRMGVWLRRSAARWFGSMSDGKIDALGLVLTALWLALWFACVHEPDPAYEIRIAEQSKHLQSAAEFLRR